MKADIILAGTILQWVPKDYKGIIFGTGGDNYEYKFTHATIIGVRGLFTKANMYISPQKQIPILGDPGLLMLLVFQNIKPNKPHYKLGVVLHFVDIKEPFAIEWVNKFSNERNSVCFINVLDTPRTVISKIVNCENIVSSSLHGLIVSDAYHIPNRRIVNLHTMPRGFYDYKFDDYYSSIGIVDKGIEINGKESIKSLIEICTLKPIDIIDKLIFNLDEKMIEITDSFKR